jgi:putative endonuclease
MQPRAGRSAGARRAAFRRGHLAEWVAMLFLMVKGFRPLARRYAAAGGEIDLIMRRGDLVIFVEVKARAGLDDARIAISARKQRLFARAARAWLSRNRWCAGANLRADAVFVTPRHLPVHVPQAFILADIWS